MKLLYRVLCDYTSADPDNSPREAWPTEKQLARRMGLHDEKTVRRLLRRLEVLGLVYADRNRVPPRTHYPSSRPYRGKIIPGLNRANIESPTKKNQRATNLS